MEPTWIRSPSPLPKIIRINLNPIQTFLSELKSWEAYFLNIFSNTISNSPKDWPIIPSSFSAIRLSIYIQVVSWKPSNSLLLTSAFPPRKRYSVKKTINPINWSSLRSSRALVRREKLFCHPSPTDYATALDHVVTLAKKFFWPASTMINIVLRLHEWNNDCLQLG